MKETYRENPKSLFLSSSYPSLVLSFSLSISLSCKVSTFSPCGKNECWVCVALCSDKSAWALLIYIVSFLLCSLCVLCNRFAISMASNFQRLSSFEMLLWSRYAARTLTVCVCVLIRYHGIIHFWRYQVSPSSFSWIQSCLSSLERKSSFFSCLPFLLSSSYRHGVLMVPLSLPALVRAVDMSHADLCVRVCVCVH